MRDLAQVLARVHDVEVAISEGPRRRDMLDRCNSRHDRVSNGDQVSRVTALALKRGRSVDLTEYWQRHVAD
jgi:hypothetical protein